MEQELTYPELQRFCNALSLFGALPGVPEPYANSKNLKKASRLLRDLNEIRRELFIKRVERDEEGNPSSFEKPVPDKNGETKELRITDKRLFKEYRDAIEALEKDNHKIDIHQVPYARFKVYIDKYGVDNNILAELLDIYITDGEVGEEKAEAQ